MSCHKPPHHVIGMTLIVLLLAGCSAPPTTPTSRVPAATSTSVRSVATPTAQPLTAMPTQASPLAMSAEEIVGTWQKTTGTGYIRFYEDGAFRQANALSDLDNDPFAIGEVRFEGTQMLTRELSVSGVPSCSDIPGFYEVQLLEGSRIQIVTIQDRCSTRERDLAAEYELVR